MDVLSEQLLHFLIVHCEMSQGLKICKVLAKIHCMRQGKKFTVNSVLSGNSKRRPNTDYSLMLVKSIAECSKGEHSAILSTFIKLPFVINIFVLTFFEWLLKTGFTER